MKRVKQLLVPFHDNDEGGDNPNRQLSCMHEFDPFVQKHNPPSNATYILATSQNDWSLFEHNNQCPSPKSMPLWQIRQKMHGQSSSHFVLDTCQRGQ